MNLGTTEIIIIFAALFLLILPIVIGAIIFFAAKSSKTQQDNLKKCPFCAELIRSEAIVCRFCGRDLTGQVK